MKLEQIQQLAAPLLPPLVSIWPPATWVVGLVLGLVFLLAGAVLLRWYRRNNLRRYACKELTSIQTRYQESQDAARYLHEVNLLLRRIAVRNFSRDKVASLTGDEWLEFLDWSNGRKPKQELGFVAGSGRILAWGAYQAEPENFAAEPLYKLVRVWIRRQT